MRGQRGRGRSYNPRAGVATKVAAFGAGGSRAETPSRGCDSPRASARRRPLWVGPGGGRGRLGRPALPTAPGPSPGGARGGGGAYRWWAAGSQAPGSRALRTGLLRRPPSW